MLLLEASGGLVAALPFVRNFPHFFTIFRFASLLDWALPDPLSPLTKAMKQVQERRCHNYSSAVGLEWEGMGGRGCGICWEHAILKCSSHCEGWEDSGRAEYEAVDN